MAGMKGFSQITIVGVGLLGGSVGLAAKAADESVRVVGLGRRRSSLDKALAIGAIDRASLDYADALAGADLVVLASPLEAYEDNLRRMADCLPARAVLTDVGSVKGPAVRQVARILGPKARFVGSHPMAGGERKGPEFARADLFANAACILTPTPRTSPGLTARVEQFWQSLGAVTLRMSPARHDRAVSAVSHLPHVLAALLVALQDQESLKVAGPGFLDTTRIASGDSQMWRQILLANRAAVLASLKRAQGQLKRLGGLLASDDGPGIARYLQAAKTRRDELVASRRARQE
jgi:prephenate dehydrogenase